MGKNKNKTDINIGKIYLLALIALLLTTITSVVYRDGMFDFEMLPLPLLMSIPYVFIASSLYGIIILTLSYINKGYAIAYTLSFIYLLIISIIGLRSAPQAIF